jgi:hypothetical protein
MRISHSTGRVSIIIILTVLVAGNAAWCMLSGRTAPWIAVAAYGVVALSVAKSRDYLAGLIVGIAGSVIHAAELAFQGAAGLVPLERAWLYANVVLPLALAGSSWGMISRFRRSRGKSDQDEAGGAGGGPGRLD